MRTSEVLVLLLSAAGDVAGNPPFLVLRADDPCDRRRRLRPVDSSLLTDVLAANESGEADDDEDVYWSNASIAARVSSWLKVVLTGKFVVWMGTTPPHSLRI